MGLPDPITRKEVYLNAAAGGSGTDTLPDPITREETYLKAIAEGGGGGGGSLGTKLTSTVSGDTLTFTNAGITASAVIDGPYIQGALIGLLELDDSTTGTLVYTLEDDSADGATAYIWVRS